MTFDVIVVGGGFYGCQIAVHLARRGSAVALIEAAPALMTRSSFVNQARVHTGYHYPRSFTTAYRSRINAPRFLADFGSAVTSDFTSLYGLARRNSKVTVRQMERFCAEIGAPLAPAPRDLVALFDADLIERVYLTDEAAFDANAIRRTMDERLAGANVRVVLGCEATRILDREDGVTVHAICGADRRTFEAATLLNCTYSRVQQLAGDEAPDFNLRHEIAEMVLVEPAPALAGLGVTVMDGPFFSTMPFPARDLHTVSHVRYTPHRHWREDGTVDPYAVLDGYAKETRADRMLRDIARYLPEMRVSRPIASLFEIKTVLLRSEGDDGRPIVFERHGAGGRLFSVLGGKIDNVYDVLERLDGLALPSSAARVHA